MIRSRSRFDGHRAFGRWFFAAAIFLFLQLVSGSASAQSASVAVAPQYDTTHVYVAAGDMDAFVKSFLSVFGGTATNRVVVNVLPVPSSTDSQLLMTPAGWVSVFAFHTPIPYPFGQERTGYLVTDMDAAISAARAAGAEVIVAPFTDPIGRDAVIQWPGGVKMQLYWHFKAPDSPPLHTVPENRIYISQDALENFLRGFVAFSHGRVVANDRNADAGEIGRPGDHYERVRIESAFGKMQILVTDGHLPYPFGRETTGYEVANLDATLEKATAAGAKILFPPYTSDDRKSAIVEFPGVYIAEIHSVNPTRP
jgi:predicted enzyme related to lactoylglutathione lyase